VSDAGERSPTAHVARGRKGALRQPAHRPGVGPQRQTSPGANLPQAAFSPGRASPISGGGQVTAAACPRRVRDEVSDVMCCLRESIREPAFASALALLVSGNRADQEHSHGRRFASEAFAEDGRQ
jgi:hypothetical protein